MRSNSKICTLFLAGNAILRRECYSYPGTLFLAGSLLGAHLQVLVGGEVAECHAGLELLQLVLGRVDQPGGGREGGRGVGAWVRV